MNRVYKIVLLFFIQLIVLSGFANKFKIPQITSFYKNEYKAGNRNWSIAHGNDGYIYIGNDKGLLCFDGVEWQLNSIEGGRRIRTVFVADDGLIYTGGSRDIGYWKRDDKGKLHYTSLKSKLVSLSLYNREVWRIFEDKQKNIIFQGFSMILKYDGEKIDKLDLDRYPSLLVNDGEKLLASNRKGELLELTELGFSSVFKSDVFKSTIIKGAFELENGLKLIATKDKGLFIRKDNQLYSWNVKANELLLNDEINCALCKNNLIFIGTINSGIYIINKSGNILYNINSDIHLKDNTILSMEFDQYGRLWFAMSVGLAYAELNNPLNIISDNSHRIGAVHDVAYYKGHLYLATNKGVFYSPFRKDDLILSLENFKSIDELSGLTWSLEVVDDQMFCGHNNGTFLFANDKIKKLTNSSGANSFKKIIVNNQPYVLSNSYNSLMVFEKSPTGLWQFKNFITGFSEPTKEIVLDYNNQIWLLHSWLNELYTIKLQDNLKDPYRINVFNTKMGLPVDVNSHVTEVNNRIVITSTDGIYTYDRLRDSIVIYNDLLNQFGNYNCAYNIFKQNDNMYWAVKDRSFALFETKENNENKIFEYVLNKPHLSLVEQFEKIVSIDSIGSFICLENGLGYLSPEDLNEINNSFKSNNFELKVKANYFNTPNDKQVTVICQDSIKIDIPFKHKRLEFSVATLASPGKENIYSFYLKGEELNDEVSSNSNLIRYERLEPGSYSLTIKAKDQWGDSIKPQTVFIEVQVPFYLSNGFLIALGLLCVIVLVIVYLRYRKTLREQFQEENNNKNKIIDEIAQNENYQKVVEEKNILEQEVQRQNHQIANNTLNSIRNKEVLISLKKELKAQKEKLGIRYPEKYYKKIVDIIDKNIDLEEDWHTFEKHFDEANGDFFSRLKEDYPQLTPRDLRMCAYLKMNMSSKEIAPLLNISERSVEVHRYRLRKKLDLQADHNLSEFMIEY